MKKTLLLACMFGFMAFSQKATAAISQSEYKYTWVELNQKSTTTVGNSTINWSQAEGSSEAVITGLNTDLFKFTLNLGWQNGDTLENIAYVSGVYNKNGTINESLTKQWGFYATGDGLIVGNNNGSKYTDGPTTSKETLTNLDTDSNQKVDLLARLNKTSEGGMLWSEHNGGKASTIYNGTSLRYADYPILSLTVNTDLVSSVYAMDSVVEYRYATDKWSKVVDANNVVYKTSGEAKYTHDTQSEAGTKDIIITGSGLFYVSTKENDNNKGDITLSNNIYLGSSSSNYGSAHFNNDSSGITTLNGNIYIIEDAVISARGTQNVIVNGTVTDKNVDGSSDLAAKLTLKGQGYIFNNAVNVTSIEFSDNTAGGEKHAGATFKQGFTASNVTLNAHSNIISESVLTLTNVTVAGESAILNSALELSNGCLTMAATLDLGENSLVISEMELAGSLLESLTEGGSITLFTGVSSLSNSNLNSISDASVLSVSDLFTNLDNEVYKLSYNNGVVSIGIIPEPTTATLSLLALAGLAARRRRR